jgi:hypothetical protein
MFTNTLPPGTDTVLEQIKGMPLMSHFYLSGGTAFSLQLGHRESEDLDFFNKEPFDPLLLQQQLSAVATKLDDVQISENTLNLFVNGVKLQFLHYPYNLLESTVPWNGISLSSVVDIACTKLITVSMRGSKKDFIDLYRILQDFSLEQLFEKLEQKYQGINYNVASILKSITYFDDAEAQPMPRMHIQADWDEVKKTIEAKVKAFVV